MPRHKVCVVPKCNNTSFRTPNRTFITVPIAISRRKVWFKAAKMTYEKIFKPLLYFCQDHFDMEHDMEMSPKGDRLQPKRHIVPHKFDCQRTQHAVYANRRSGRLIANGFLNTPCKRNGPTGQSPSSLVEVDGAAANFTVLKEEISHEAVVKEDFSWLDQNAMSSQAVTCEINGLSAAAAFGNYIIKREAYEENPVEREELYVDVNAEEGLDTSETQSTGDEQDPFMDTEPPADTSQRSPWRRDSQDSQPNRSTGMFAGEEGHIILGDCGEATTGDASGGHETRREGGDESKSLLFEDPDPGVLLMANDGQEMYVYEPVNVIADAIVTDVPSNNASAGYTQEYWSEDATGSLLYSEVDSDSVVAVGNTEVDESAFLCETDVDGEAYVKFEPSVGVSETYVYETENGNGVILMDPSVVEVDSQDCEQIANSSLVAVKQSENPTELLLYECTTEVDFAVDEQTEDAPETLLFEGNGENTFSTADEVETVAFVYSPKTDAFVPAYEMSGDCDSFTTIDDPSQQAEPFVSETSNSGSFVGWDECTEMPKTAVSKTEKHSTDRQSKVVVETFACDNGSNRSFLTVDNGTESPAGNLSPDFREDGDVEPLDSSEDGFEGEIVDDVIVSLEKGAGTSGCDSNAAYPVALWQYKELFNKVLPDQRHDQTFGPGGPGRLMDRQLRTLRRAIAWHQIQKRTSLLNKKIPASPSTCNVCGRKLRRKQCLHVP